MAKVFYGFRFDPVLYESFKKVADAWWLYCDGGI